MTAITKAWTNIADAAVDPDSPLTTSLITALRDNDIHLREWLGASYTAGAVQDHSHDGVDSALVETGGNALRNGSFETGLAGWTFADYSGGSHAISTSAHRHGAQSITFTSTSTVNGGGEAVATGYTAIAQGEDYPWKFWVWASVANVSSKVQLIWYDNAKASISTTDIYTSTNTATAATLNRGATTAPTNARWVRLKLIGGVPGSGSATGTIRFDGVVLGDIVAVNGTHILAASIAQGHLKATFGDVSTTSTAAILTLAGGPYGFYPQISNSNNFTTSLFAAAATTTSATPASLVHLGTTNAAGAAIARQYYVQASPPYDLGNGDIPLFVFAAINAAGEVLSTYVAEDPPWANNGPTNIRADKYANGRAYQVRRNSGLCKSLLRGTPEQRNQYLQALLSAPFVEREITQEDKQADMPLIPHPFPGAMNDVTSIVLLDPVGSRSEQLLYLCQQQESIPALLHDGYIEFDNEPISAQSPPGVAATRWRWKRT